MPESGNERGRNNPRTTIAGILAAAEWGPAANPQDATVTARAARDLSVRLRPVLSKLAQQPRTGRRRDLEWLPAVEQLAVDAQYFASWWLPRLEGKSSSSWPSWSADGYADWVNRLDAQRSRTLEMVRGSGSGSGSGAKVAAVAAVGAAGEAAVEAAADADRRGGTDDRAGAGDPAGDEASVESGAAPIPAVPRQAPKRGRGSAKAANPLTVVGDDDVAEPAGGAAAGGGEEEDGASGGAAGGGRRPMVAGVVAPTITPLPSRPRGVPDAGGDGDWALGGASAQAGAALGSKPPNTQGTGSRRSGGSVDGPSGVDRPRGERDGAGGPRRERDDEGSSLGILAGVGSVGGGASPPRRPQAGGPPADVGKIIRYALSAVLFLAGAILVGIAVMGKQDGDNAGATTHTSVPNATAASVPAGGGAPSSDGPSAGPSASSGSATTAVATTTVPRTTAAQAPAPQKPATSAATRATTAVTTAQGPGGVGSVTAIDVSGPAAEQSGSHIFRSHVHVTTSGTGPVTVNVSTAGSSAVASLGSQGRATSSHPLSGKTSYDFDVSFNDQDPGVCPAAYVGVQVSSGGVSVYKYTTPTC